MNEPKTLAHNEKETTLSSKPRQNERKTNTFTSLFCMFLLDFDSNPSMFFFAAEKRLFKGLCALRYF